MSNENTNTPTLHSLNNDVIHNFDLSIIMSFYKRYEEFARVLPHNVPYFQRNGIEVIIAMDEPSEKEKLIALIKQYPFINWKVIVNDKEYSPCNHAPVLNYFSTLCNKEVCHANRSGSRIPYRYYLADAQCFEFLSRSLCVGSNGLCPV